MKLRVDKQEEKDKRRRLRMDDSEYIIVVDSEGEEQLVSRAVCERAADNALYYIANLEVDEYTDTIALDYLFEKVIKAKQTMGAEPEDIMSETYKNLNITIN